MLLQETHEDLAAAGGTGKNFFYKTQENIMTDICSYKYQKIKISNKNLRLYYQSQW